MVEVLSGERILLRSLSADDAEAIERYASDKDVAKTTLNIPHPYPKGSAVDFVKSILKAESEGRVVIFALIDKEEKKLIGLINLNLHAKFKRGELGYWVGKPFWGKGYGTEASQLIIQYGFKILGLNRIYATAFTDNPGSWRIMEKCGMKHEGVFRQHVIKDGIPRDLTYYSILREEYQQGN